jgi:hypothetical protein
VRQKWASAQPQAFKALARALKIFEKLYAEQ